MAFDLDDQEYEATRKMFNKDEKPGLYGRTNKGKIIRFAWLQDENGQTMERCVVKFVNGGVIKYWLDKDEKIVKYSKNIIGLIEEGDFVNGKKIISAYLDGATQYIKYEFYDGTRIYNEDIKSIVTKELYKQIEYIVE